MHPPERLEVVFICDPDLPEAVVDFLCGPVREVNRGDGLGDHNTPECPGFRQGNALGVLVELILHERQDPLDRGSVQDRVIIGKGAEAIHRCRITLEYPDEKGVGRLTRRRYVATIHPNRGRGD